MRAPGRELWAVSIGAQAAVSPATRTVRTSRSAGPPGRRALPVMLPPLVTGRRLGTTILAPRSLERQLIGPTGPRLRRLLEDLVEAGLQVRRFLLHVVVVYRDQLERGEGRVARRWLDVGAARVDPFRREELLHGVPDHELGEGPGGAGVGRALDHRGRGGDGEGPVGRAARVELGPGLA